MKMGLKIILFCTLFSYSLAGLSKTIIVTDIDDTIKKANSMGGAIGAYHFLLKKPFLEMRDLFLEIKTNKESRGEAVDYFYVSAAFDFTFDAQEWLAKYHFPEGFVAMRSLAKGLSTYEFKYAQIKKIISKELKKNPDIEVYFFGDNSDQDAIVYNDIVKEFKLSNAHVFIRDVSTEATYFDEMLPIKKLPGLHYFFSEIELINQDALMFMSSGLKNKISANYQRKSLVPEYTLGTLSKRLKEICLSKFEKPSRIETKECKTKSDSQGRSYWNEYYRRF